MTACQQKLEDREPTVQARRRKNIVTFTGNKNKTFTNRKGRNYGILVKSN